RVHRRHAAGQCRLHPVQRPARGENERTRIPRVDEPLTGFAVSGNEPGRGIVRQFYLVNRAFRHGFPHLRAEVVRGRGGREREPWDVGVGWHLRNTSGYTGPFPVRLYGRHSQLPSPESTLNLRLYPVL